MAYMQAFLDGRGEDHDDCHSFSELVQAPPLYVTQIERETLLQHSTGEVVTPCPLLTRELLHVDNCAQAAWQC